MTNKFECNHSKVGLIIVCNIVNGKADNNKRSIHFYIQSLITQHININKRKPIRNTRKNLCFLIASLNQEHDVCMSVVSILINYKVCVNWNDFITLVYSILILIIIVIQISY